MKVDLTGMNMYLSMQENIIIQCQIVEKSFGMQYAIDVQDGYGKYFINLYLIYTNNKLKIILETQE